MGTKEAPPFAYKNEDGRWGGISIWLWRKIADELGLSFEFQEADVNALIHGVRDRRFDLAIAAITVTHAREKKVDFSHPYFTSGLGVAVKKPRPHDWSSNVKRALSPEILVAIFGIALVVSVAGFLIWRFERRGNAKQFGGGARKGLMSGLWWSAVTMTTVGYGDKVPKTGAGRAVAIVWMFLSVVLISLFTATVSTTLTVESLTTVIDGPEDLPDISVGSVVGTIGTTYLIENGIDHETYKKTSSGLDAVVAGEIDAFVHDAPLLQYLVRKRHKRTAMTLPGTLDVQHYAIAMRPGSKLREPINRALLREIGSLEWRNLLNRHLGKSF